MAIVANCLAEMTLIFGSKGQTPRLPTSNSVNKEAALCDVMRVEVMKAWTKKSSSLCIVLSHWWKVRKQSDESGGSKSHSCSRLEWVISQENQPLRA